MVTRFLIRLAEAFCSVCGLAVLDGSGLSKRGRCAECEKLP
jgi:hypothetical protein